MEVYGIIYLLIDGINDMEYVGQTKRTLEKRFKEHAKENTYIGNAIRSHGEDMFVKVTLKVCYSPEELSYWERHFIKSRDTMAPNGYNCTTGGERDFTRSPETCAKISASKMGEKHPQYGKPLSDEHRAKISASTSGEKNPNFGKHHSPETCAKISAKNSGENHPNYGKHHSDKTRARMSASSPKKRPVVCLETGERFESVTAAAKHYNILKSTNISFACKNPHRRAGGYHWRYAEEVPEGAEIEIPANSRTRPVICLETGERFNSVKEAGQHYNINPSYISWVCQNTSYKAASYHFRHADEIPDGAEIEIPPDRPKKTTNRAVICVEIGEQFNSLAEAARHYSIDDSSISKSCRNANRKCGGFHWKYADAPQA